MRWTFKPHICTAAQTNVSWPLARRATMGYKGIQGQYLPSGTVPMQTYQTPGAKDFNFHY